MKRNKFSLSHYKLFTCDMGQLIPITWFEVLPGDTVQQSTSTLLRVSPLLSPVMHPCTVRIHHFFVPNRLLWEDWEDFITGGQDGLQTPEHPYMSASSIAESSLFDYMGVPPNAAYSPDIEFSALPFRAYNLIYNEYYRDQDLVTSLDVDLSSGEDTTTTTDIQKVAWAKDYFTTARLWAQKGSTVTIPLGDSAPIKTGNTGSTDLAINNSSDLLKKINAFSSTNPDVLQLSSTDGTEAGRLYADLSNATGINIEDLRLALSIQRYQEARAKYGSRIREYIRYAFGVKTSDARLQNPEFLGGGRQIIQFSEVLQTAEGTDPVGEMRGHGISALRSNRYRRFFEEHGIVMSFLSVVPKTIYTSQLFRHWNREVKEDYFQKELSHLGDQEILNREIQAEHSAPTDVFGYQDRYDEYRYLPSGISGEFRTILNYWHLGRIFSGDVTLNQSFTDCTPTKRILASQSTHALYVMCSHNIQARRAILRNSRPMTF